MKKSDPVEQLVEDIRLMDPTLHKIVQGVRQIVKLEQPKATEIVKYGGIMFQVEQPFCGVYAYQQHVSLEFGQGHRLDDAHKVLEGNGKFRRHITLKSPDDVAGRHVADYVRQSLALTQQAEVPKSPSRAKR